MKVRDVPQDNGLGLNEDVNEVCYAVDETGKYVLVQSTGWEPKTVTNEQAWEVISEQVRAVVQGIHDGKLSILAYHMTKNQMTVGLLTKYVPWSRWRVKCHLKPKYFKKLPQDVLQRYADIFGISLKQFIDMSGISNDFKK
jgi:hypothetical protein